MNNMFDVIMESAAQAAKASLLVSAHGKRVDELVKQWFKRIDEKEGDLDVLLSDLKGLISLLSSAEKSLAFNYTLGKLITKASDLVRSRPFSTGVMERLIYPVISQDDKSVVLVINPGSTSTKIAWFEGMEKHHEMEIHLAPELQDTVLTRTQMIREFIEKKGLSLDSLTGIACRGGFMSPVPSGTYQVSFEMVEDLAHPRIKHASNMAILIGKELAKLSCSEGDILITTSDPVVCDEMEVVERLTGFSKIKRDGSGAHYLNHKAIHRFLSSIMGKKPEEVNGITAHIGGGSSIARHKAGKVTSIVDAFAGIPSANRCGSLDLPRLLNGLSNGDITMKELNAVVFSRGGLLSLAGTNDFRALSSFTRQGATLEQVNKIQLIFDFYGRQIAKAVMQLCGDGVGVDFVAITGGLAYSPEIRSRLKESLGNQIPLIFVPGSMEHESLAANLMKAQKSNEYLKDYVRERDSLFARRREENRLMDQSIFKRPLLYRKHGSPITSLDEVIDSAIIKVKENFTPIVGIIGADNEDVILAAKRANQEGLFRIAKFRLIGDYSAISKLAYDYDLVIDNDNFTIDDHEDPVARGVELFDKGEVHILMKGSLHTDEILRGIFSYLKSSGKLKKGEVVSHCVVMDIPTRNKLTTISDAAVIPYPDKKMKMKIIKNAIRVAGYLNINKPKIAVISAVENVNKSVASSIEAKDIAEEYLDRTDIVLEGPLSFDVAMNHDIAVEKGYPGKIKGNADVLIMPDIDAGNILYKTLTTQSGAICAGIILAGDVPVILTSRGDTAQSKLASVSLSVVAYFKNRELQNK
jgi:butyrate kinase